jgi:hypothetical protein
LSTGKNSGANLRDKLFRISILLFRLLVRLWCYRSDCAKDALRKKWFPIEVASLQERRYTVRIYLGTCTHNGAQLESGIEVLARTHDGYRCVRCARLLSARRA